MPLTGEIKNEARSQRQLEAGPHPPRPKPRADRRQEDPSDRHVHPGHLSTKSRSIWSCWAPRSSSKKSENLFGDFEQCEISTGPGAALAATASRKNSLLKRPDCAHSFSRCTCIKSSSTRPESCPLDDYRAASGRLVHADKIRLSSSIASSRVESLATRFARSVRGTAGLTVQPTFHGLGHVWNGNYPLSCARWGQHVHKW